MKALVYEGPGKKSWSEKPDPRIQHPSDVVVRMLKTTICGTDLVSIFDYQELDKRQGGNRHQCFITCISTPRVCSQEF